MSIVSDNTKSISNARLQLDIFSWTSVFTPIYSKNISIANIPALSAISVPLSRQIDRFYAIDYIYRVQLFDSNGHELSPERVQLPNSFVDIDPNRFGVVRIDSVTR
jgi:hypothetical protein